MSTGQSNSGPMISLWMSPDLVFRVILDGFTSGENLEHNFGPPYCGKRSVWKWISNSVGSCTDKLARFN